MTKHAIMKTVAIVMMVIVVASISGCTDAQVDDYLKNHPELVSTVTPEQTPYPTSTPTQTPTMEINITPTITPTATPTMEINITPTITPTATITGTPTSTPTSSLNVTTPESTPEPTDEPTPTYNPAKGDWKLDTQSSPVLAKVYITDYGIRAELIGTFNYYIRTYYGDFTVSPSDSNPDTVTYITKLRRVVHEYEDQRLANEIYNINAEYCISTDTLRLVLEEMELTFSRN